MNPQTAANVIALRQGIENLIEAVADNPEIANNPNDENQEFIKLIRDLCQLNAGRHNLDNIQLAG